MIKKNSYLVLILYSVFLTFTVSFFSAISVIFNVNEKGMILFQILAFSLMAFFFTRQIIKSDTPLKKLGFSIKNIDYRIFIMLGIIVLVQPIMLGIDLNISLSVFLLTVVQMILVGYTEELLFRGLFFLKLKDKGTVLYVIFSSLIFGLLHSASAFNPETGSILVILQVVHAFLLGIIFALIFFLTKKILVVILAHSFFNIFASISNQVSLERNVYSVIVLSILYVFCIIVIVIIRKKLNCVSSFNKSKSSEIGN
ncbi:CPBP family intramembrane metalloprotease [Neobacillus sp. MM2021_6]|uniref:CPBP family intramembrane glutamic endopeptidase n=1 Tax=Bacillaceae TaxID=186817 RepID=UPI00140D0FFE|nr:MULTISPECIES: type II CAAX endopeptidase family protein [Bacillaceae]MBO0960875.1 CPBP family intramembrane metalloprotease [Neobacillus sp. MM2021_6]NHC21165.1 CPBP family intramembrane metalloprotease [Bacillus sp. MM2020_4]